jgi:hypothetical protein
MRTRHLDGPGRSEATQDLNKHLFLTKSSMQPGTLVAMLLRWCRLQDPMKGDMNAVAPETQSFSFAKPQDHDPTNRDRGRGRWGLATE